MDYQWSAYETRTLGGAGPTLNAATPHYGMPVAPPTILSSSKQDGKQFGAYIQDQVKLDRWSLLFAAYGLTQQNVPTPDPDHNNYRVQTGEVRSRGIELEGLVTLSDGWKLIAAITSQDVEVTKSNGTDLGKRPAWIAETMLSLWAEYTFQSDLLAGLGVGAGGRYVGPTYANATNMLKNDPCTT
jgi:Outer membrane receptor for monomeric catechols